MARTSMTCVDCGSNDYFAYRYVKNGHIQCYECQKREEKMTEWLPNERTPRDIALQKYVCDGCGKPVNSKRWTVIYDDLQELKHYHFKCLVKKYLGNNRKFKCLEEKK